jgi:hypothetical protein
VSLSEPQVKGGMAVQTVVVLVAAIVTWHRVQGRVVQGLPLAVQQKERRQKRRERRGSLPGWGRA